MQSTIKEAIQASIEAKTSLLQDAKLLQEIETVAQACIEVYRRDGKVLFCGNGGSAADAQHLAAELSEAAGRKGDLLFAISTSGNSPNVLLAAQKARSLGLKVVAMTGQDGGKLRDTADYLLNAPSRDTPRIQECHMLMGHTICQLVEAALFTRPRTS